MRGCAVGGMQYGNVSSRVTRTYVTSYGTVRQLLQSNGDGLVSFRRSGQQVFNSRFSIFENWLMSAEFAPFGVAQFEAAWLLLRVLAVRALRTAPRGKCRVEEFLL